MNPMTDEELCAAFHVREPSTTEDQLAAEILDRLRSPCGDNSKIMLAIDEMTLCAGLSLRGKDRLNVALHTLAKTREFNDIMSPFMAWKRTHPRVQTPRLTYFDPGHPSPEKLRWVALFEALGDVT